MNILFLYKKIQTQAGKSLNTNVDNIVVVDLESAEMRLIGQNIDMCVLRDLEWEDVPPIVKLRLRCCMASSSHKRVVKI